MVFFFFIFFFFKTLYFYANHIKYFFFLCRFLRMRNYITWLQLGNIPCILYQWMRMYYHLNLILLTKYVVGYYEFCWCRYIYLVSLLSLVPFSVIIYWLGNCLAFSICFDQLLILIFLLFVVGMPSWWWYKLTLAYCKSHSQTWGCSSEYIMLSIFLARKL